jgi:preprotein translocase subunit SecG
MGAAFGSGASGSLFGATGSSNFLSKSTAVAAAVFFAATLALSFIGTKHVGNVSGGVMENLPVAPAAPATNAPPAPAANSNAASQAAPAATEGAGQANQIPK